MMDTQQACGKPYTEGDHRKPVAKLDTEFTGQGIDTNCYVFMY